jgi:hypothetical protein
VDGSLAASQAFGGVPGSHGFGQGHARNSRLMPSARQAFRGTALHNLSRMRIDARATAALPWAV